MKIEGRKRIRNLQRYLFSLKSGASVVVGIKTNVTTESHLAAIGFGNPLSAGDTVLPSPIGPVSSFNAFGGATIHRDRPMETAYRTVLWHWQDWGGNPHSKFVDVPYERYPRTPIPPPAVQLTANVSVQGEPLIVGPVMQYDKQNLKELTHAVNLFLELFGECEIFDEALGEIVHAPVRQLNWRVLPPGQHPWSQLRGTLRAVIQASRRGNHEVVEHRMETINRYGPSFVAVGQGGFHGYVVFGFPGINRFMLESSFEGNATYVFDERWETLARLTKAEILINRLQTARVIHREASWPREIAQLLAGANRLHAA